MKEINEKNGIKRTPSRKRIIITIIFNVLVIAVIAVACIFVYRYMLKIEKNNCWSVLENSAQSVEKEINMQVESNVNILKLVAGAMVREQRTHGTQENKDAIISHLNDFQDMTIFDRIDLVFENGDILLQTGEIYDSDWDFKKLAGKGIHFSDRMTDIVTNKEIVCCAVPVAKGRQTVAVLIGIVECEKLSKIFKSDMYDGRSKVCLVDRPTGDFIMDDWHEEMGNLYEQKERKLLPGYEHIDLCKEISQGNKGTIAYESHKNGKASYMYFQPVKNRDWHLIIVAQENVVFSSLFVMKRLLGYMILIVVILMTGYLIWSVITLREALKRVEESEKHSYIDNLTGLYNQNKFKQTLEDYEHKDLSDIGLLFLDLNGLKYTNDHFGHDAGDQLLKNTAQLLFEIFGDSVYRIGGDEFVVLMSDMSEDDFKALGIRVKAALKESGIEAAMGLTWHKSSKTVKVQLKEADDLMYVDKRSYHERNSTLLSQTSGI